MTNKIFLGTLVVFSLWNFGGGAAARADVTSGPTSNDGLTLQGALSDALNHSPRVQAAQAAAKESGWRHTESLGELLPQVSVQASHYFDIKYQFLNFNFPGLGNVLFPFIFPETQATLDAHLNLFDGLQNINDYQASGKASEAAELSSDWTRFQTTEDIELKFYQALAAKMLAEVAEKNVKTLEDHLAKVKVRRSGGAATRYDVLRVEVQLDEAKSEKLSSDDNVIVARMKLNEGMGVTDDERGLLGGLPVPRAGVIGQLAANDLSARKDLAALRLQTEAADKKQAAASSYWVPRISLDYQLTYYNNVDYTFTSPFVDAHAFGIFVNWNIFDGAVAIARHQEAAQETIQAESTSHAALLKYKTDFEFWRRRYLYSTNLYDAKLADVEKAQESVRLSTEGYRAGVQTSSEVLDSELDLFRARAGVVTAQVNAAEALINLELTTGRKF